MGYIKYVFCLCGWGCAAPAVTPVVAAPAAPATAPVDETPSRQVEAPPRQRSPGGAMDQILAAHNQHRRQHCAPPLRWSPRLARVAARWARHLARAQCAFEHSPSSDYGENLFFAAPSNPNTGLEAVETWYNEHREYNFRRGRFDFRTGHFTQLVWRNTTDLGCARSRCNGGDLWVCNYHPPGNVRDHYRANVLAPSCEGAAE